MKKIKTFFSKKKSETTYESFEKKKTTALEKPLDNNQQNSFDAKQNETPLKKNQTHFFRKEKNFDKNNHLQTKNLTLEKKTKPSLKTNSKQNKKKLAKDKQTPLQKNKP